MKITAISTPIFHRKEPLVDFVQRVVPSLRDGDILAITSKLFSVAEGRWVPADTQEKESLIREEADHDLGEIGFGVRLTIARGLFLPSAGIDASNVEGGGYLLYPVDPFASAQVLWKALRQVYGISQLGILVTDSHTSPLRRGVTGIALAHWGFSGLCNRVGEKDLFGRPLQATQSNLADGLAAAAVLLMGEAAEQTPLALIEGAPVVFQDETSSREMILSPEEDLYYQLYKDRM